MNQLSSMQVDFDYSQSKEQKIILNYFGDKVGTFLSLGENDGEQYSNVRALALCDWSGTAVEPSESAFKKLRKLYDDTSLVECFKVAIGEKNGEAIFHESGSLLNTGDDSLVSTIVPTEMNRWPYVRFFKYEVPVWTVAKLLKHSTIKQFNFISIDCEGLDLAILKQMNLRALGCELLCVEWNGKNRAGFDAVVVHQGYAPIHVNAENIIYALK